MSIELEVDPDRPILPIELIPTAIPLPLKIIGTDQFAWGGGGSGFGAGYGDLDLRIGQVNLRVDSLQTYAIDEFGALANVVNNITLTGTDNRAMIEQEILLRSEQNFALSQQFNTMLTEMQGNTALIASEATTRSDAISAVTQLVTVQASRVDSAFASIETETTTRATQLEAMTNDLLLLEARLGNSEASLLFEIDLRATEDSAMASQMSGLSSEVLGMEANLTQVSETIAEVDGELRSNWQVKASVRADGKVVQTGVALGAAIGQDGTPRSEIILMADTIAFTNTLNGPLHFPFLFDVANDTVYLDQAVITDLTFTKLKSESGEFVVSDDTIQARYLNIKGINVTGPTDNRTFWIDEQGNAGFSGELQAATGSFGGELLAGTVDLAKLVGITHILGTPGTHYRTVPASQTSMRVTIQGAGGGGGGGSISHSAGTGGGGGGGGAYSIATFHGLTAGNQVTIQVGSGGSGGGNQANGGNGGASLVVGFIQANGGVGGQGGDHPTISTNQGGAGATGGNTNGGSGGRGRKPGYDGTQGYEATAGGSPNGGAAGSLPLGDASKNPGGGGGGSVWGTGGRGGFGTTHSATSATAGNGFGAGGGGGAGRTNRSSEGAAEYTNYVGGAGSPGKVIIEFFNPNGVVIRSEWNVLLSALQRQGIATT